MKRFLALGLCLVALATRGADTNYWDDNPLGRPVGQPILLDVAPHSASLAAPTFRLHRYDNSPLRAQPLDLEAKAWLTWEPEALRLVVRVTDDTPYNPHTGARIWDGDCVQIALVRGRLWREFAFAKTPAGDQAYCWEFRPKPEYEYECIRHGPATNVDLAIQSAKGGIVYNIRIPASLLGGPLKPEDLRFSLVAFDHNNRMPLIASDVKLSDGVMAGKYMAPFAHLRLGNRAGATVNLEAPAVPLPGFRHGNDAPLYRSEVALLGDDPVSPEASALAALYQGDGGYGGRIRFFDMRRALDTSAIASFSSVVILPRRPDSASNLSLADVRAWAQAGKPVVMDLSVYARLIGQAMEEKTVLPPDAKTGDARADAAADENLPIPMACVAQADGLSAGYPVGSEIPWCGRLPRGEGNAAFIQKQMDTNRLPAGAQVIARSSLPPHGAVWLKEPVGKGCIFAADFSTLGEPTLQWEQRGAYNKYAILQNALGHGLRYGVYFNRRPTCAQYVDQLKQLAARHTNLTLTVEGYARGMNRHGLCIGNPDGPIYLYTGMLHAADEYQAGFYGLYGFAKYLAEHADEEPLKSRLQKIGVKIIPMVLPELYCDHYEPGRREPEARLPASNWGGLTNRVELAIQQHHGMGPLTVGFGCSLGRGLEWGSGIAALATKSLYQIPPSVYWNAGDAAPRPVPINKGSVGVNPPSWDSYFDQDKYLGLVNLPAEIIRKARLNVLSEHTVMGRSPAFSDPKIQAREYISALLSDQTASYLLASLLLDPVPDRP